MKLIFRPEKIDFKFEIAVLCFYFVTFIIYQVPSKIEPYINDKSHLTFIQILSIVIIPTFFIFVNSLFYFICREYLFFRIFMIVGVGVIISISNFMQTPGIVDPVYYFVISVSCAVVIGIYKGNYFDEQLEKINNLNESSMKLIEYARDGYKYFLGKAFQGWIALGASLGISMSILFRKGFENPELTFTAIKMLIGFICITISVGIWVIIPMLNGIVSADKTILSLKSKCEQ